MSQNSLSQYSSSQLVLASASPRRQELLNQLGLSFAVHPASIDESALQNESPESYVSRLAKHKALAVQQTLTQQDPTFSAPILGADTVVVLEEQLLGKPGDAEDARQMLRRLSGVTHKVLTGIAVVARLKTDVQYVASEVRFRQLSAEDIDWYVTNGEPMGKAGAYAIQGKGALFVSELRGSYSNVVGLPLCECGLMLREAGVDIYQGKH